MQAIIKLAVVTCLRSELKASTLFRLIYFLLLIKKQTPKRVLPRKKKTANQLSNMNKQA